MHRNMIVNGEIEGYSTASRMTTMVRQIEHKCLQILIMKCFNRHGTQNSQNWQH